MRYVDFRIGTHPQVHVEVDGSDIIGSPIRCNVSCGKACSLVPLIPDDLRVNAGEQFKFDATAEDKAGNQAIGKNEKVTAKMGDNSMDVVDLRNGKYSLKGIPKKSGRCTVRLYLNDVEQKPFLFNIDVLPGMALFYRL